MPDNLIPIQLNLKKDEQLEVVWKDGQRCVYSLIYLRSMCPCAQCKIVREGQQEKKKKSLLTILPGNYAEPLRVVSAQLVGNYALQLEWSDQHGSGIYSFEYLREICPTKTQE